MRAIQNPQVFPPHKQLSVEFLAAAERLSRASATIFPVRAVSLGQMSLATTHSQNNFPGRFTLQDRSIQPTTRHGWPWEWSAPDNKPNN
jgi:hypothetical protein